jgi:hypothetical protein
MVGVCTDCVRYELDFVFCVGEFILQGIKNLNCLIQEILEKNEIVDKAVFLDIQN